MGLLTKDNLIKIVAFIIVIGFLLETFAFQRGSVTDSVETTEPEPNETESFFGRTTVNATVTSYGEAVGATLTVIGSSQGLDSEVAKMKQDGLVAYTTPLQGGVSLNLARGANVTEVTRRLSQYNLTVISRADVALSEPLSFNTETGKLSFPIKNIRISLDPSIPIGYIVTLRITATFTEDALQETSYEVIPYQKEMFVTGEVVREFPQFAAVAVLSWENRDFNKTILGARLSDRFENVSLETVINGSVALERSLSEEELSRLEALNLSYLRMVGRTEVTAIPSFTDKAVLEADISQALSNGSMNFSYPYSYALIRFTAQNYSFEYLNSTINSEMLYVSREQTVRINEKLYDEKGKAYRVLGREFTDLFPYTGSSQGLQLLRIEVNVLGDRILNYTVLQ